MKEANRGKKREKKKRNAKRLKERKCERKLLSMQLVSITDDQVATSVSAKDTKTIPTSLPDQEIWRENGGLGAQICLPWVPLRLQHAVNLPPGRRLMMMYHRAGQPQQFPAAGPEERSDTGSCRTWTWERKAWQARYSKVQRLGWLQNLEFFF